MYNTINKIARRTCTELEGLKISQLEDSYRQRNATITITPSHVITTGYNTFSKLVRRTYGELYGLKIAIVENSYRTHLISASTKIIKCVKKYVLKLKLIQKYVIKLKH